MAIPDPQLKIDIVPFMAFVEKLRQTLPTDMTYGEVLEAETLAVLQTSAKKIKRTTKARAGGKYNLRSKSFNGWVPMNGKFYYVSKTGKGKQGRIYSDSMWNKLMQRMNRLRKRAETRVGLSKAVFYRVAKDLKLNRYGTGWGDEGIIKEALYKSGGLGKAAIKGPIWGTRKVATVRKRLRNKNPSLEFTISSTNTFNPFTGGVGVVENAFSNREKYFEMGVKNGLLESTANIAKNYPKIDLRDN